MTVGSQMMSLDIFSCSTNKKKCQWMTKNAKYDMEGVLNSAILRHRVSNQSVLYCLTAYFPTRNLR